MTMNEDNIYLLFCYLIFGLTLLIMTIRSKHRLKTVGINMFISWLYSGYFIYNLTFNSYSGKSLAWLIFLMFAIGLHWIINIVGILLSFKKK